MCKCHQWTAEYPLFITVLAFLFQDINNTAQNYAHSFIVYMCDIKVAICMQRFCRLKHVLVLQHYCQLQPVRKTNSAFDAFSFGINGLEIKYTTTLDGHGAYPVFSCFCWELCFLACHNENKALMDSVQKSHSANDPVQSLKKNYDLNLDQNSYLLMNPNATCCPSVVCLVTGKPPCLVSRRWCAIDET